MDALEIYRKRLAVAKSIEMKPEAFYQILKLVCILFHTDEEKMLSILDGDMKVLNRYKDAYILCGYDTRGFWQEVDNLIKQEQLLEIHRLSVNNFNPTPIPPSGSQMESQRSQRANTMV